MSDATLIGAPERRRWRLPALVAGLLAAIAGAFLLNPMRGADAVTLDPDAYYVIVNQHSGLALDVWEWSTADGGEIRQFTRSDAANQQWRFLSSGDGYYRLQNRHSGKVLDIHGHSTADGADVVQWSDLGNPNQQFRLIESGGYVRFVNRNSNKVLDVWGWSNQPGGDISQYADLNGANQRWTLIPVSGDGGGDNAGGGGGGGGAVSWPAATGEQTVNETIQVSGTFDGGLTRFVAGPAVGDGGQGEGQDPVFRLADGATIENVILGAPAADGIHCDGECTIRNVWWEDVGEDAATFRADSASDRMLVDGGGARHASDKVFQHNGTGTLTIRNFEVEDFGKLYRSCGTCTGSSRHVVLENITAIAPGLTIVGIDPGNGDTARFSNITVDGDVDVCQIYDGTSRIGEGPGANCIYSASDITYR
ncbi:MAG: pectate lyase [Actinomycetota bacterium]|nr:pectate lyase [Actinomycetota bacterium]